MTIEGVPISAIRVIAKAMAITLQEQELNMGRVKARIWPTVGSNVYRTISKNGRVKMSLCFHAQYMFMAHIFAKYPQAIIKTWYMTWNYALFQAGAQAWTANEIGNRVHEDCDCDPSMIDKALQSPDEINRVRREDT